jgi:hypothetical protein
MPKEVMELFEAERARLLKECELERAIIWANFHMTVDECIKDTTPDFASGFLEATKLENELRDRLAVVTAKFWTQLTELANRAGFVGVEIIFKSEIEHAS